METPIINKYNTAYAVLLSSRVADLASASLKLGLAVAGGRPDDVVKQATTAQEEAHRAILDLIFGVTKS